MFEPKKDESSLDALKKRLYTRGELGRRPLRKGRLPPHQGKTPEKWGEETLPLSTYGPKEEKPRASAFKKLFLGALIFFVLAFAYAAYEFLAGGNVVSTKNIGVTVLGPAFASGGDEISLQVSVENRNSVPLEFAELLMEYPRGAPGGASTTPDMVRTRLPLPKIPAGGTEQEIVKATLYGEESSEQNIKFTLEYRVQGSNAIFQKESVYPVRISSAPINLSLQAPKEINASQGITLDIKASSNAQKDVPGVLLEIDYPPGFLFKEADPKPTYGQNVWRLGDFHAGSSRSVRVVGTLSGENGDERTFRILGGAPSSGDEKTVGVIYNSIFQTVAIHRPFLDAQVLLNGDTGDSVAIPAVREVKGDILWKNNLPTRIVNAEIDVKFSGNALNRAAVAAEHGFYNSSADTIVWDKNSVDDFRVVEPGATGRLSFTFTPAPLFAAGRGLLPSPEVDLTIVVKGEVNVSSEEGRQESATQQKIARISSDLQLLSRAVYSGGPFQNSGPMPPLAEGETTYTILWSATNSANQVEDAAVSATLPPYVAWLNKISPASEDVSYDEGKRVVTWRLHTVLSGAGYGNPAREAAFQVGLKPSLSHVGSSVSLTGGATLSGTDSFSGASLEVNKNALTTLLSSDPYFKSGDDIVQPPK